MRAGVTFVVAAGNSGWDFDFAPNPDVPAAYPEVLTVTALSDSDGRPGAHRPALRAAAAARVRRPGGVVLELRLHRGRARAHDRRAGRLHQVDLARGRLRNTISGTSMASPHMRASPRSATASSGSRPGRARRKTPAQNITLPAQPARPPTTPRTRATGSCTTRLHSPIAGRVLRLPHQGAEPDPVTRSVGERREGPPARGTLSGLRLVARDRGGDPVLGVVGGVDRDGVDQDREGDRVAAGVAVAGERRDVRRGCRSWPRSCPRPRCPRIRSATVPSRPATGSELRNAAPFSASRAIATSSLPTSCGETALRRERPEPSTAWTSVPTESREALDRRGAPRDPGAALAAARRRAA